jgi:hypothetical protein
MSSFISLFNSLNLSENTIGKSNLYEICVTILTDYEDLSKKNKTYENLIKNNYEKITTSCGDISVIDIAYTIINLEHEYSNEEYIYHVFKKNWKSFKPEDSTLFDPYAIRSFEYKKLLSESQPIALIRALRFYLLEMINNSFPKNIPAENRTINDAQYIIGKQDNRKYLTNDSFKNIIQQLNLQLDELLKLTPQLTEITNLTIFAKEQSKLEKEQNILLKKEKNKNVQLKKNESKNFFTSINVPKVTSIEKLSNIKSYPVINWTNSNLLTKLKYQINDDLSEDQAVNKLENVIALEEKNNKLENVIASEEKLIDKLENVIASEEKFKNVIESKKNINSYKYKSNKLLDVNNNNKNKTNPELTIIDVIFDNNGIMTTYKATLLKNGKYIIKID